MAKWLREKGLNVLTAFVTPIPMGARSVEVCCMYHVLKHMVDVPCATELIGETRRMVMPGGSLVLGCPNYDTWGRDFYKDYTHNYITTARRVKQLLLDLGYKVLDVQFYSAPIFGGLRYPVLLANRLLYSRWLNRLIKSERYYNGFLTFLGCFIVVARNEQEVHASPI